jgi:YcxB-like protein
MKIVYRISEQDFMDAQRLYLANLRPRYRRFVRSLMPWIGALVLIIQIAYIILVPERNLALSVIGFLIGFYLIYCGHFAIRRSVRRFYRNNLHYKHEFTADISESGVHIVTAVDDSQSKWEGFVRFLESDRIFMLFYSELTFIIFPKHAFAPGEAEQFRELLRSNIPTSK